MRSQLPKKAKKVFKGIIFDAYQWKQKLFDNSSAIFEAIVRQDTVEVIATIKNKIVVLRQQQPGHPWYYSLPGGRMDIPEETSRQAAIRELREETGLGSKKLAPWLKLTDSGRVIHTTHMFIARDCKVLSMQSLDKGEKIKIEFHSFNSFLSLTDRDDCYFGPTKFKMLLLLARIHPQQKNILYKQIFG